MDWNLKKMWLAAATSLVAVTSVLSAADDMQMRNLENRVTALEQRKGANGMINPSARPGVRDGSDVFITGAALYWKSNADNLDYAIDNTSGNSIIFADDGKVKQVHGKWDWGFQVGLGYNTPHDGWDLYANWIHFNNRSKHHDDDCECNICCTPTCSDVIFPTLHNWQTPGTPTCLYNCDVDAHWKMHLNIVDLELGRDFFVSKYLSLRPNFGLRWAQVRQSLHVEYDGFFSASPQSVTVPASTFLTNAPTAEAEVNNRTKFWGIGPRAGMNTLWSFGSGFGLYGNAAISLLYGKVKEKYHEELQASSSSSEGNNGEVHKNTWETRAATDLALGVEWDYQFKDEAYHIGLMLGWEHHMFFGIQKFIRFFDTREQGSFLNTYGDLATQGVTLTARFDF